MLAHIKCTDTSYIYAHMLYAFLFLWIACMYPHVGISGLRSDLGSYASKFAAKSAVLLAGPFLGFNTLAVRGNQTSMKITQKIGQLFKGMIQSIEHPGRNYSETSNIVHM